VYRSNHRLSRSVPVPVPAEAVQRHVLVVDDSRAQRRILAVQLTRWGYRVTEAASGEEALAACQTTAFDIILSDWMMTGMTGVELCRAFRDLPREDYGYFILLTSKSEKAEIASGLEAGADDFLTKPVGSDELRARLRAGERILGMQTELVATNRLICSTLSELQKLYDSLDRDLIEARKLQQTLVRDRQRDFGRGKTAMLVRPSGHVGGDLVGCFEIDSHRIAIFSVDVSGHGVASAMMTVRLAGLLSAASPDQNIALTSDDLGRKTALSPAEVAARLNRMMIEEMQVEQYFTLVYAEIDLMTGQGTLVQAGHPHPVIMRAKGAIHKLGQGGLPIGLIASADYDVTPFQLFAGDRLLLVSDGVTECPGPDGNDFGEDGLETLLIRNAALDSVSLLEIIPWDLAHFSGGDEFPDDVSGIIFDYSG
jgi:phosphoserine phosphatase RsbU/P